MKRLASLLLLVCAMPLAASSARAQDPGDSTAIDWSQVPEYRIVPGDLLALNFGPGADQIGDLLRECRVRPDGRISVYPVGDIVAAGRTVRELESSIVQMLGAELKLPRVTVEVKELAGNVVHVLGRVEKPGSLKAEPFLTVVQAIAGAGGFKDDAARNSVLVFHRDGARTVRVVRVSVDRAIKRGDLLGDLPLSRFDIVYVPRSSIGNVDLFARQFFGETAQMLSFGLLGWELFNLDRVFVTRVAPQ